MVPYFYLYSCVYTSMHSSELILNGASSLHCSFIVYILCQGSPRVLPLKHRRKNPLSVGKGKVQFTGRLELPVNWTTLSWYLDNQVCTYFVQVGFTLHLSRPCPTIVVITQTAPAIQQHQHTKKNNHQPYGSPFVCWVADVHLNQRAWQQSTHTCFFSSILVTGPSKYAKTKVRFFLSGTVRKRERRNEGPMVAPLRDIQLRW